MTAGACNLCGKCCEAIHIPYTPEQIARMDSSWHEDARFINRNWAPITKEEAFAINPHFSLMASLGVDYGAQTFYTCKKYDKETKLCTAHEDRPSVCSGYPWYGRKPHVTEPFYTKDCGYMADVADEWHWKGKEEEKDQ